MRSLEEDYWSTIAGRYAEQFIIARAAGRETKEIDDKLMHAVQMYKRAERRRRRREKKQRRLREDPL
jgi:hypothetical protein